MSKQIFINLPVSDLAKSTAFYEALGFIKSPIFSNELASGMEWGDNIFVMLLTHDFYKKFPRNRTIADAKTTSSVLIALSFDSKDGVQKFADAAKANGGDYYEIEMGAEIPADSMFGYEVEDPDGHIWEPMWMNPEFKPN